MKSISLVKNGKYKEEENYHHLLIMSYINQYSITFH